MWFCEGLAWLQDVCGDLRTELSIDVLLVIVVRMLHIPHVTCWPSFQRIADLGNLVDDVAKLEPDLLDRLCTGEVLKLDSIITIPDVSRSAVSSFRTQMEQQ